MVPLQNSDLAKQIVAARSSLPTSKQGNDVRDTLGNLDVVYEVSPSLVIAQEIEPKGTTLIALMKNEHHVMVCTLLADDDREAAAGIQISSGKGPFDPKIVSGRPSDVQAWAEDYVVNGAKICVAVPYADARKSGPKKRPGILDFFE